MFSYPSYTVLGQSKKVEKHQDSIQSSPTPDQGNGNATRKHHVQEVNPFPADDHKAARTDKTVQQRQNTITI